MIPTDPAAPELLAHGELDVAGRLIHASNATFFCTITLNGTTAACVYKPIRGERPLWDFPDGTLANREVATYLLSEATGWSLVPPTVLRPGPLGPGMVQLWVHADSDRELVDVVPAAEVPAGWCRVLRAHDRYGDPALLVHADTPGLRRMAVLDVVVNNADRKGGHVLLGPDGEVYGVDHGICLHAKNKLRTVLWGYLGEPLPGETLDVLRRLRAELCGGTGPLGEQLAEHLTGRELRAVADRIDRLLDTGTYPAPSGDWPAIPWPAF